MEIEATILSLEELLQLPQLAKMNLVVSGVFLLIALLLFLYILLCRYRDGVRLRRQKWIELKAQQYITSYLFEEEDAVTTPADFKKKYLTTAFRRQTFLNSLILLHKNLTGETSEKLELLYRELCLLQHSKQKLYASEWNEIAEGISELTEMGMQQETGLISAFINHPHATLRSEAQVALVRLEKNAPFSFLTDLAEPLQDWQQMQLARAAQKAHLVYVPDFTRWLVKQEDSIVIFSIRMIVQYNQHQSTPALAGLLHHAAAAVRQEVYIALRQLEAFEAAEKLMELHPTETPDNQQEILRTLPAITFEETFSAFERSLLPAVKNLQVEDAPGALQPAVIA